MKRILQRIERGNDRDREIEIERQRQIYIYRERDRDRDIYIYIYIERERERERDSTYKSILFETISTKVNTLIPFFISDISKLFRMFQRDRIKVVSCDYFTTKSSHCKIGITGYWLREELVLNPIKTKF